MTSTEQGIDIEEIPRLNIQSDWKEALRVPNGKAWISCSQMNQPTVYGELVALESKTGIFPTIQSSDDFEVTSRDKNSLTLSFPGRRCSTKFIAPSTVSTHLHKKAVRSVDVSPGGALGVSAGDDGSLILWETGNGSIRHELQGHISDVNTCRFFPSGKVVLSGGADLRLKIWSAEDGSCPVTLKGHAGGVTDTAIVERGRNILSCSRDGTVRLWDCGQARCLAVVSKNNCPVNSCTLADLPVMTETPVEGEEKGVYEVGTEGKLLLLAKEDGWFEGVDVYNRKKVFQFKCPSAVNCCAFLSEYQVVGGTDNGSLWLFDVRDLSFPLGVIRRSASPIRSLLRHGDHGCLATTGDGCCFLCNPQLLSYKSEGLSNWELTGPDCDPVYSICRAANTVFTACRDSSIRKYILKQTEIQG